LIKLLKFLSKIFQILKIFVQKLDVNTIIYSEEDNKERKTYDEESEEEEEKQKVKNY